MFKKTPIIFLLIFSISCTNSQLKNAENFEIHGEFNHTILDCDNTENLNEINCVEFIKFIDQTNVHILIDGSDIWYTVKYAINDDKIDINTTDGVNICSFLIQNEMTLKRIGSSDIWTKKEETYLQDY